MGHPRWLPVLAPLVLLAPFVADADADADAAPATAPAVRVRVLVDSIHAHNFLHPPATEAQRYDYHYLCGHRRAFDYLRARGAEIVEVADGRLTPERLAGIDLLFVNLVSADKPPFLVSEIRAIKAFVEAGGGLLLITDHSNCYFHMHKLAPLLEELGIEGRNETACDRYPDALGTSRGWITVTRFKDHPVTRGLRRLAMLAGGTVDDRFAVATTSENGWGDLWRVAPYFEGDRPGFYGNFAPDPGERTGTLGVLLARELGKGRVVIVPDQNMLADQFLHYADNHRLFLNAVAWLTGEPALAEPEPYLRWCGPRALAYEDPRRPLWGNTAAGAYYHAFVHLGREVPGLFAGDDPSAPADLLIFATADVEQPAAAAEALVKHVRAGGAVVILTADALQLSGRRGLVATLAAGVGKPRLEAERDALVLAFEGVGGAGRAVVPTDRAGWTNAKLPSPTEAPDLDQRARIVRLVGVVKAQLRPRDPAR